MKKLLLVLLVVTLASFLFVGCLGTGTVVDEDEDTNGEDEVEPGICPTVHITSQVAVAGKNYIKDGVEQTITVTFAVPTEPVSVWIAPYCWWEGEKGAPDGVPDGSYEIVLYPDPDNKVYTTEELDFSDPWYDCCSFYIYVVTCETCAPCKYPYIVDNTGPETEIKITSEACICVGCDLTFKTPTQSEVCGETGVCCDDYCSGFASYTIDLYASDPFDLCCDIPCITPKYSCPAGVACPVDCTLSCVTGTTTDTLKKYWTVVTLLDVVGNKTRYYSIIELDSVCGITVTEYSENKKPTGALGSDPYECTDWLAPTGTDATIGACL